jgi:hypothetical protein
MQISTIKNPNFEKPFRNPSNRTQVNILKKNFFGYLSKKIWFRVCSVTAKMFELRNSGKNRRKRSEIFFENLPREYKDLILVKKKFEIISCLCTFKDSPPSVSFETSPMFLFAKQIFVFALFCFSAKETVYFASKRKREKKDFFIYYYRYL